jgi:hypothetical protein
VFSDDLNGQASIIDGDTLEIHGTGRARCAHARLGGLRRHLGLADQESPGAEQTCSDDNTNNTNVVSALHVLSWRKSEQSFEVRFRARQLTPAGFLWTAALPCRVRP